MDLKEHAAVELETVRRRSLDLLDPLTDADLIRQHSRLMSPLVWDLAHIGNYEDLWLVRAAGGLDGVDPSLDELYDAFRHPRPNRPSLPLLSPSDTRRYIAEVRGRAFDVLNTLPLDPAVPLVADGFVVGLVVQHEHQHDETMLATLQLMAEPGYRPVAPPPPRPDAAALGVPAEVQVPGGPFLTGTDEEAWAYDNERPAHVVDIAPFWIDSFPVTNGQYQEFIEAGGYSSSRWWTPDGWDWRQEAGLQHPEFWRYEGPRSWSRDRFGWVEEVPPEEPVQHVCWYEADAYARWAGKRLPTEAEWEKAAAGAAVAHANLGGRLYRPAPIGAYPEGVSRCGAHQLIGDVWEWTSSDFSGYPGFASFPYREYSEVFFGPDYKVLRGGSWATDPSVARVTFRNWDYPIRRQIFAGFRCARDG
jgi:gamma-glutamyl hercynylcysteine S-oxide synthase